MAVVAIEASSKDHRHAEVPKLGPLLDAFVRGRVGGAGELHLLIDDIWALLALLLACDGRVGAALGQSPFDALARPLRVLDGRAQRLGEYQRHIDRGGGGGGGGGGWLEGGTIV